jgi:L-ascorbate metabolism protein UlaG (beta-lactamase superfamily)
LVVPIHWDDFFEPLDRPLRAMPYLVDRVDL